MNFAAIKKVHENLEIAYNKLVEAKRQTERLNAFSTPASFSITQLTPRKQEYFTAEQFYERIVFLDAEIQKLSVILAQRQLDANKLEQLKQIAARHGLTEANSITS